MLVEELSKLFPRTSVRTIVSFVTEIQKNAAALGILGGIFIFWTSLSLFSVLESAFNIVYGRPNRSFLHGKALALGLLTMSLVTLFFGLIAGSFGSEILKRSRAGVRVQRDRRVRPVGHGVRPRASSSSSSPSTCC